MNESDDTASCQEKRRLLHEYSNIKCYIPARYVYAIMGFFAHFNMYVLRNNINVAIVEMVNATEVQGMVVQNGTGVWIPMVSNHKTFAWSPVQQGFLLGCYYYGYVITNVPGAWLSHTFGSRIVIGMFCFISSVLTLF